MFAAVLSVENDVEAGVPRLFASVGLDENAASLAATALAYAPRLPAMLAAISLMGDFLDAFADTS